MKVSDIIIYIMKIDTKRFEKNSSESFQSPKSKVQILNEVALWQVVRKRLDRERMRTKIH